MGISKKMKKKKKFNDIQYQLDKASSGKKIKKLNRNNKTDRQIK